MASADSNLTTMLDESSLQSGTHSPPELVSDSIMTGIVFALVLTVGQKVIGFARGILFCRFMTDQELGQWSMAWSSILLFAPLAALGLPGCFGRFTEFYRTRGQLTSFISRIAMICAAMTVLLMAAMVWQTAWLSETIFGSRDQIELVFFLSFTLAAVSVYNFASSLMESLRQVRVVTTMRFVVGVLFAIIGAALISTWENKAGAAAVAYAISSVAGLVPAAVVLWKFRGSGLETVPKTRLSHGAMWKRIAPFAIWLWASNFCHNFFEVADRYMLIHWSSESFAIAQGFVGQYHSGRVVPLLLVSIAAVLGGVLLPYMSAHWEAGEKHKAVAQLNWTVKLMALLFTAGGILVILLAPILFDGILQGRYNDGQRVLPMTLVYCIWFSLFVVGQDYLWVAEKGKWAALSIFAGLTVNVSLNMLLIPSMGLGGAVTATMVGNIVNVLMIFGFNHIFGCRANCGVWACTAVPLILLTSPAVAIIAMIWFGMLAIKTEWFFTESEKESLAATADKGLAKVKLKFGH